MANHLPFDKKVAVVSALVEGGSIRGVERMTGVNQKTIIRLGRTVGEACARFSDGRMRDLTSRRIEVDEMWGFIAKKERNTTEEDHAKGLGSTWLYVAHDVDTKVVPCHRVGDRDSANATLFMEDLAGRLANRIELSTDGWIAYEGAVETNFGCEVDYGQIVKKFLLPYVTDQDRRYSGSSVTSVKRNVIVGNPEEISTSHVEKNNHTIKSKSSKVLPVDLLPSNKPRNIHLFNEIKI